MTILLTSTKWFRWVQVHYQVGTKVRQTIKELGGTMPENLPTPEKEH